MIPQNLIRTPRSRANIPLPVAIAGSIAVALLVLVVAVAIGTTQAPDVAPVTVELPLQ